jgi:hypothetical protein
VATDDDRVPASSETPRVDVLVPRAPTEDRAGVQVVRLRNTPAADPTATAPTDKWIVEAGEMRPMSEGRPLNGAELVTLKPRDDVPAFDVDVLMPRDPQPHLSGPPQVATDQYRKNWSETFGADDDPNVD